MRTLVSDPPPAEIAALLARRRRTGADRFDEVWQGVLHVNPAPSNAHSDVQQQLAEVLGPAARAVGLFTTVQFNLGDPDNYRIPDAGIHRRRAGGIWNATAALAVEVVSPGDETWDKLDFYATHRVDELLIVDPQARSVRWLALDGVRYTETQQSGLINLGPETLAAQIDWPEVDDERP